MEKNMKTYYKDFCGATASITEHKDGTATLRTNCGGKKTVKAYISKKAALSAWRRLCA
jgi:hypothetical protein